MPGSHDGAHSLSSWFSGVRSVFDNIPVSILRSTSRERGLLSQAVRAPAPLSRQGEFSFAAGFCCFAAACVKSAIERGRK
jgi:hypothetical protein